MLPDFISHSVYSLLDCGEPRDKTEPVIEVKIIIQTSRQEGGGGCMCRKLIINMTSSTQSPAIIKTVEPPTRYDASI